MPRAAPDIARYEPLRASGRTLARSAPWVRFGLVSATIDGGVDLHLLAVFPKANEPARKFLTAWRAGRESQGCTLARLALRVGIPVDAGSADFWFR